MIRTATQALVISAAVVLSGCAFTTLRVDLPATSASAARAASRGNVVILPPITDQRGGARIGMRKNLYGWQTADVVANQDPLEWLRARFSAEMKAAGFVIASDRTVANPITYKIYLQKLFVEPVTGESFSVDFEADIEMRVAVSRTDGLEAERLYYEKAIEPHRLVTDFSAAYVGALDEASRAIAKKAAADLTELARRYPP